MEYTPKKILNYGKRLVAGLTAGFMLGIATPYFLSGCDESSSVRTEQNDDGSGNPTLPGDDGSGGNPKEPYPAGEWKIKLGLERPGGGLVSKVSGIFGGLQKGLAAETEITTGEVWGSYIEGPIFSGSGMLDPNLIFNTKPYVDEFNGTIDQITKSQPLNGGLSYFWNNASVVDLNTTFGKPMVLQNTYRPRGLNLDTLLLADGVTLLLSSNPSDKVFAVDANIAGQYVWLQNSELRGILDMILKRDGTEIIAVQSPLYENLGGGNYGVLRSKRVISINTSTKSISTLFTIPTTPPSSTMGAYSMILNGTTELDIDQNMHIVENSDAGKLANGNLYYISDRLDDRVLKYHPVDGLQTMVFLSGINLYPAGIDVRNSGNPVVTESSLLNSAGSALVDYTRIWEAVLSPESLSLFHEFPLETLAEVKGDFGHSMNISGQIYVLPSGFSTSLSVVEDPLNILTFIIKNISGDFLLVSKLK